MSRKGVSSLMRIMHDVKDIFDLPADENDAVCVTTNGITKRDGRAVMGKGIALDADMRFHLSAKLGEYLKEYGNRVFNMHIRKDVLTGRYMRIITFPTKYNWRDKSDLFLIKTSAEQLIEVCNKFGVRNCYLPCPGCSNGGLDWETQVRPVLEPILDDRFIIADRQLQH